MKDCLKPIETNNIYIDVVMSTYTHRNVILSFTALGPVTEVCLPRVNFFRLPSLEKTLLLTNNELARTPLP